MTIVKSNSNIIYFRVSSIPSQFTSFDVNPDPSFHLSTYIVSTYSIVIVVVTLLGFEHIHTSHSIPISYPFSMMVIMMMSRLFQFKVGAVWTCRLCFFLSFFISSTFSFCIVLQAIKKWTWLIMIMMIIINTTKLWSR